MSSKGTKSPEKRKRSKINGTTTPEKRARIPISVVQNNTKKTRYSDGTYQIEEFNYKKTLKTPPKTLKTPTKKKKSKIVYEVVYDSDDFVYISPVSSLDSSEEDYKRAKKCGYSLNEGDQDDSHFCDDFDDGDW